jgi:hypothetical protein
LVHLVLIGIDELIVARHHFTRKGFRTVERPLDISWAVDNTHAETVRLLTSEKEASFATNCLSDMATAVAAFVIAFIGVLIRHIMQPLFFESVS